MAVYAFVSKAASDASCRVSEFIDFARNKLTVFGASLEFDAYEWPIGVQVWGNQSTRKAIRFAAFGATGRKAFTPLPEPYCAFAKAYVRYTWGLDQSKALLQRLSALQALGAALVSQSRSEISSADTSTFNEAARLLDERMEAATAYRVGTQLANVAAFLDEHRMTVATLNWRSPLRKPQEAAIRVGKEAERKRAAKLPSEAAISAMTQVYRLAADTPDVVLAGIFALFFAAPERISEILRMPADCEVESEGRYGLRWWPVKGGEPMVKWVLPVMEPVIREAIARVRRVTEPAREIARWYEQNPDRLYLPPELEELRQSELIDTVEIGSLMGTRGYTQASNKWVQSRGLIVQVRGGGHGKRSAYRFADVEKAFLAELPTGFPILDRETGLRYSEALFVTRANEMDGWRSTYRHLFQPVSYHQVDQLIGGRTNTVFAKHGLTEPDGSPIIVNTHQFRHWMNTIAQKGGLSQDFIAFWSGRQDPSQNKAYDHVTADEVIARVRDDAAIELSGPIAEVAPPREGLPSVNQPMTREEFLAMEIPAAHTTDLGFCIHDFTILPCQLHGDCVNCGEHVVVKGDGRQKKAAMERLEEARKALNDAKADDPEGAKWGLRWLDHHEATVKRLQTMVDVHDDPAIPDGAITQLPTPNMPSEIRMVVEERARRDPAIKALISPFDAAD